MTVVVYTIGAVLILAAVIAGAESMPALAATVLTATIVAGAGVVVLYWRRANLQRVRAEIRDAPSVIATGPIEEPSAEVAELIGELRRLGFGLAGALDTLIVGGPPIRTMVLTRRRGPATTWVEVGLARKPVVIFLSRGGDGRFLETIYPDGATIDHPDVLTRPIGTTIDDALDGHLATLAEWTSRAGPPLEVRTLKDYRRVEADLRLRTGGMRIALFLEQVVEPGLRHWAISAAIGLVTFVTLLILPAIRP